MSGRVVVRVNQSTEDDIREHLLACDDDFQPRLSLRVAIPDYARKIRTHGTTIEAWHEAILVGLVAYYRNEAEQSGFVTNVSVSREFQRQKIATQLFEQLFQHAATSIMTISLEVSKESSDAVRFYENLGFSHAGERDNFLIMKRRVRP